MTYVLTVSVCPARGADENLAGASEDHAGDGGGNGHLTAAAAVSHPKHSLIVIQIIKSFPECLLAEAFVLYRSVEVNDCHNARCKVTSLKEPTDIIQY